MGRDAGQTVGLTILERIKQDIALDTTEAASRKSRGETIAFDTSGARGRAAQASLSEATKAFDLKWARREGWQRPGSLVRVA